MHKFPQVASCSNFGVRLKTSIPCTAILITAKQKQSLQGYDTTFLQNVSLLVIKCIILPIKRTTLNILLHRLACGPDFKIFPHSLSTRGIVSLAGVTHFHKLFYKFFWICAKRCLYRTVVYSLMA